MDQPAFPSPTTTPDAPSRPTGRRGAIKRFFLFASGADPALIDDIPVEQVRYVSIGAAVIVTSLFAAFSIGILLSTVFGLPIYALAPLGIIWGLAIFNLDRWIVSTVHYGNLSDPDKKSFLGTIISKAWLIPRLLLAVVLGLFISEPLLLHLYKPEINTAIETIRSEQRDRIEREFNQKKRTALEQDQQIRFLESQLDHLQSQEQSNTTDDDEILDDLDDQIEVKDSLIASLQTEIEHELQTGPGPRFDKAQKELATAELQRQQLVDQKRLILEADDTEVTPAAQELAEQIATRRTQILAELAEQRQSALEAIAENDGLLLRQAALDLLISEDAALQLRVWLPRAVILIIDILPVFLKLLAPESVHDRRAKYSAAIKSLQARFNFESHSNAVWARLHQMDIQNALAARDVFDGNGQHEPEVPLPPEEVIDLSRDGQDGSTPGSDGDTPRPPTDRDRPRSDPPTGIDELEGHRLLVGSTIYKLTDRVGEGGTGFLYLAVPSQRAMLGDRPIPTVLKIVPSHKVRGSEGEILGRVSHPAIAHLIEHDTFASTEHVVLALEYHPNSSLDRYLFGRGQERVGISVGQLITGLRDLVGAAHTLWSFGIVHADGKPENVLVADREPAAEASDPKFVLTDFGEAFHMANRAEARPGFTPPYAPPEVIEWAQSGTSTPPPHTLLSDVYSLFGGTVFYVLSGGLPPIDLVTVNNTLSTVTSPSGRPEPAGRTASSRRRRTSDDLSGPRSLRNLATRWLMDDPGDRVPGLAEGDDENAQAVSMALTRALDELESSLTAEELAEAVGVRRHRDMRSIPEPPPGFPKRYLFESRGQGVHG